MCVSSGTINLEGEILLYRPRSTASLRNSQRRKRKRRYRRCLSLERQKKFFPVRKSRDRDAPILHSFNKSASAGFMQESNAFSGFHIPPSPANSAQERRISLPSVKRCLKSGQNPASCFSVSTLLTGRIFPRSSTDMQYLMMPNTP